jgi:hypothetical protein
MLPHSLLTRAIWVFVKSSALHSEYGAIWDPAVILCLPTFRGVAVFRPFLGGD